MNDPVPTDAGDITRLLQRADQGDVGAVNELFVLVEPHLRQIVFRRKRQVPLHPDPEASTTVLIDEVILRLTGRNNTTWHAGDRRKFFGYAARQIHCMLIDLMRRQQSERAGGKLQRHEFDDNISGLTPQDARDLDLLIDLHEVLARMEAFALDDAVVFRIRFFLGCTFEETAEIMGASVTGAKRGYERARLWLQRELKGCDLGS